MGLQGVFMKYLHTMLRVTNLEKSLHFYEKGLGFKLLSRNDYSDGEFTLAFLRAPGDGENGPSLELTFNWGKTNYEKGDAFGHLAFLVSSISEIQKELKVHGYDLSWGPGASPNGKSVLAFIDDPDGYEIELIERK